ncbi:MAG: FAD-binding protein, partial [Pseudanabaena sp. LacPavin_0818_WC45_MAG_42_6]|nr:FAD-binding protein [Pseudanabaena sp. LacPavin_0818_WC45_MAG_42_6]
MTAIAPIPNTASAPTKPFDWQAIAKEFIAIVGDRFVVRTREELIAYECDGLTSYKQQPAIVVLPLTTEEVSQVVKVCDRYKVAFVARGSGTGLSGGALPLPDSVLIVTSRMKKILEVDFDNQRVVVQPGVINNWVTQAVSGAGFYYA